MISVSVARPLNYLDKIKEVYLFISVGVYGEGVIGQSMNIDGREMFMPFICTDKSRMESLKPLAKIIANNSETKVKLIKFSVREEIEEYDI